MTDRFEVTWWLGRGPSPDEFRELFVEPFNRSQSEIRILLEVLTDAARDRTVRALMDGTGPDLVMVPRAGDFRALARSGHLADLSEYAGRYGWPDRILGPALQVATDGGRLYGLPRSSETMFLLSNRDVLDAFEAQPPQSLAELEEVAKRALASGITPFGAGCADLPESSELLWTLVVNHYAGPQLVRAALNRKLAWTSDVFVEALDLLVSWFDRGWFGTEYFAQTIDTGLQRLAQGSAAMTPAMTGMLPADDAALEATPFPPLRNGLPARIYVFGTASIIGVNAASPYPEAASKVLDALFSADVRRRFSARVPGDWNIPLADDDAAALRLVAPRALVTPTAGLNDAVRERRNGYATWSYFPPRSEALVTVQMKPLVEGSLSVRAHLTELDTLFADEHAVFIEPQR